MLYLFAKCNDSKIYCFCLTNSEPPTLLLLINNESTIEAGMPHPVECKSPSTSTITDLKMWLTVNGKIIQQLLNSSINQDGRTYTVYSMSNVTFDKSDNQQEMSCVANLKNKNYTSDIQILNVLCTYDIYNFILTNCCSNVYLL